MEVASFSSIPENGKSCTAEGELTERRIYRKFAEVGRLAYGRNS
jgi:hypothetical protein